MIGKIRSIAACSANGVIGVDNKLPFNYPQDMKHFRKSTRDSIIIMGRKTFCSMGSKPLPKRENIVISSSMEGVPLEGVHVFRSIKKAIEYQSIILRDRAMDVWFIGGAAIYREAMSFVTEIHLTITPDVIDASNAVHFPWIDPRIFELRELKPLSENSELTLAIYSRF